MNKELELDIFNKSNTTFITSDECYNYGSISGCDESCPVWQKGQCDLFISKEEIICQKK